MPQSSWIKIRKAVLAFQLPDLSVVGEAGVVKLVVHDKKNDTSNDFQVIVGETESEFCFHFKVENIKVLPGAYKGQLSLVNFCLDLPTVIMI